MISKTILIDQLKLAVKRIRLNVAFESCASLTNRLYRLKQVSDRYLVMVYLKRKRCSFKHIKAALKNIKKHRGTDETVVLYGPPDRSAILTYSTIIVLSIKDSKSDIFK